MIVNQATVNYDFGLLGFLGTFGLQSRRDSRRSCKQIAQKFDVRRAVRLFFDDLLIPIFVV